MPDLQLTQFSIDPEEFANEILKVRRQFDNQFRPLLHRQRRLILTSRKKPRMERGGVLGQFGQKCCVQPEEAFALIEVMEGEAELEGELKNILHLNRSGWRSKRTNNKQRQTIDRPRIIARSRQMFVGQWRERLSGRLGLPAAAEKKAAAPDGAAALGTIWWAASTAGPSTRRYRRSPPVQSTCGM